MFKSFLIVCVLSVSIAIVPARVSAEPITATVLTIKAILAYLGTKATIAHGATKVVMTKKGIALLSKRTITLKNGASTIAVLGASAYSIKAALADEGYSVEELSDDMAEEIANRAIDLYGKGEREMDQKICIGPDKKNYVVLPWMSCGNQDEKIAQLKLDKIVEVDPE